MDFAIPEDHRVKLKESEKRDKYLDFARELKKTMKHEGDSDTNCYWCTWNSYQKISKWTGGHGNIKTSGDHPNYGIIKNDENTEKSPGDLRRLTVTKTPLEKHQLMLE